MNTIAIEKDIVKYIKDNPVMVLGTVGKDGMPHGAAVYVCATSAHQLYFITKTDTQKFKDISHHPHVSVTIVDPAENTSLQAVGRTEVEENAEVIGMVMQKMSKIYAGSPDWIPPLAKLRAGPYQVVGITLHHSRLASFKGARPGSSHIYKEI